MFAFLFNAGGLESSRKVANLEGKPNAVHRKAGCTAICKTFIALVSVLYCKRLLQYLTLLFTCKLYARFY